MEKIGRNRVEITIAGKNVTGDVSPYLSKITYTDKEEAESDDISLDFEDTAGNWAGTWYPQQGDALSVKMGNDGNIVDCGVFEIDEAQYSFPPDIMSIKGIAAAITKELRTRNSKAFEKQTLGKIIGYFADKHGFSVTGDTPALQKIEIDRKTQENVTDLAFLSALAKEYGFIFSLHGDRLVFMSYEELDAAPAVLTLTKKQLSKGTFTDRTSQTYTGAKTASRNMRKNTVRKHDIKPSGVEGKKDTLIIVGGSNNDGQAKATGGLKKANSEKITGTITVPGNAKLVAGVNINLPDIGGFSGKWHVVASAHTIDTSSGYVTTANLRKIMENV